MPDGRGNVVALTDNTGKVVDRYAYDIWGMPTTISEQVPQPLLYGGYVYDRELSGPGDVTATGQPVGWYWLSVRHYDPSLKRFLQPDPSEQEGTMSYVYAGDDPLDATDPSGERGILSRSEPWRSSARNRPVHDRSGVCPRRSGHVGRIRGVQIRAGADLRFWLRRWRGRGRERREYGRGRERGHLSGRRQ